MQTIIIGQFRVERGHQQTALTGRHNAAVVEATNHFHVRPDVLYFRGPYEHAVKRPPGKTRDFEVLLETVHLSSESVPFDYYVHNSQDWLGMTDLPSHENQPCARAPEWRGFPAPASA